MRPLAVPDSARLALGVLLKGSDSEEGPASRNGEVRSVLAAGTARLLWLSRCVLAAGTAAV